MEVEKKLVSDQRSAISSGAKKLIADKLLLSLEPFYPMNTLEYETQARQFLRNTGHHSTRLAYALQLGGSVSRALEDPLAAGEVVWNVFALCEAYNLSLDEVNLRSVQHFPQRSEIVALKIQDLVAQNYEGSNLNVTLFTNYLAVLIYRMRQICNSDLEFDRAIRHHLDLLARKYGK